jgi:RND family efflux transporter MFP subunit
MGKINRPVLTRSVLLVALAAAVAVAIVLTTGRRPAPSAPPAVIVTPVVTAPVRVGTITRTVPIAGTIRAQTETQLAARMAARVLDVPVREGDRVSRGELLVRLDDRDARAALDAAAAGVRAAEASLAKARAGVVVRGAEVRTNVATAEAGVVAARAKLAQAQGAARAAADEAAAEMRRAQAGLESAQANLAAARRGGRPAQVRQAAAAVTQAQTAAQAARRGRNDAQFLYDRGGLTRDQLDEARVADENAQAQVEAAQAALELAREGASPEERQAAEAAVRQAQAGVEAASAGTRRALLAREDATAAEAGVRQAQAGLQSARAGRAGSSVARDDVRAAEAARDQARVQWQQARDQAAATRVVSPVDGVVTLRAVDPGQIAQPGQPLVTVASGPLSLEALVSSTAVTSLRPGQPVEVTSESDPGRRFAAVLRGVPSVPGPDGRTYTVRAALEGVRAPTGSARKGSSTRSRPRYAFLHPGVRARGVVQVARAVDAVLVPPAALHRTGEQTVVWVARNGRAQPLPVTLGIQTDDAVQILAGVAPGAAVIVSGAEGLHPGDAVDAGQRQGIRILDFGFWILDCRQRQRRGYSQGCTGWTGSEWRSSPFPPLHPVHLCEYRRQSLSTQSKIQNPKSKIPLTPGAERPWA